MRRRLLLSLALTGALTVSLAGCASGSQDAGGGDCVEVSSGSLSDGVKVTGEFGAPPKASFDTPLDASKVERTVVSEGDGETPITGESVTVNETFFSGATGETLASQQFDLVVNDSTLPEAVRAGIDCLPVGTRSVAVFPATDLYTPELLESFGMKAGESMVLVTDIVERVVEPTPKPWTDQLPEVSFDEAGQPTVTLPGGEPPTELRVKVLKEGDGATVKAGDEVTVRYYGVSWNTGENFDGNFDATEPTSFRLTGVVQGFRAGLIGQKVGSQILVVMPPEFAYGTSASGSQAELADQTLVFLIQIEDTKPAG